MWREIMELMFLKLAFVRLVLVVILLFAECPVAWSFPQKTTSVRNAMHWPALELSSSSSLRTRSTFLSASRASNLGDSFVSPNDDRTQYSPNHDLIYLRWNKDGNTWKIQTAVTTFQRGDTLVDLHAQLHFADADYFDFYNTAEFSENLDHVHYELLVDQGLLEYESTTKRWRLKAPIMASPNDQNLANSYDWTCQASQIDYTQPKWVHADLTRQEFLKLVEKDQGKKTASSRSGSQPLWKLASPNPQASSTAAEAVSALLVGPPQLSYSQSLVKRRLFTNLFLPGSQLANALRAILWLTVPAPELSVILLDWSSLLNGNNGKKSSRSSSSRAVEPNPNGLSEVAWPIFSSLAKLDVASIRRFFFGQVLVSSNTANLNSSSSSKGADQDQAWSLLVTKRNDHALDILRSTLTKDNNPKVHSALLYGSSHCPDLHTKLVADGFKPVQTTWRTAWSVQENPQDNLTVVSVLTILLVTYLAVGALDWVGMMGDVSQIYVATADQDVYLDAGVAACLYLIRHVLFYVGFSKFLVDWTNSNKD
jgi:hypothetical protein